MNKEIIPLQFLRGLAASLVLLSHFIDRLVRRNGLTGDEVDRLMPMGHLGVMMFFAISGFIMVHTTQREFDAREGARQFLVRRFIRIAPLYYATMIAIIAFRYVTAPYSTNDHFQLPGARDLFNSFFFLPYLNHDNILQPVYGVGWSLNFEMMFYLVFAAGIGLGRKWGMAAVLSLLCLLCFAGLFIPFPTRDAPQIAAMLYFYTRTDLLFFVSGMVVALLLRRTGTIRTGLNQNLLCLIAGIILCTGLLLPESWALAAVVIALCVSTLLWRGDEPMSPFSGFARLFGDISYSMYLTHSFLLGILALIVVKYVPINAVTLPLSMLCAVMLCFVAGWFSWRVFELPVAAYLRARTSPRPLQAAPVAHDAPFEFPIIDSLKSQNMPRIDALDGGINPAQT